jgi:hypothetical protein
MIQDIYNLPDTALSVIYNQIDSNFWNIHQVKSDTITTLKKQYNLTNKKIGLFI